MSLSRLEPLEIWKLPNWNNNNFINSYLPNSEGLVQLHDASCNTRERALKVVLTRVSRPNPPQLTCLQDYKNQVVRKLRVSNTLSTSTQPSQSSMGALKSHGWLPKLYAWTSIGETPSSALETPLNLQGEFPKDLAEFDVAQQHCERSPSFD